MGRHTDEEMEHAVASSERVAADRALTEVYEAHCAAEIDRMEKEDRVAQEAFKAGEASGRRAALTAARSLMAAKGDFVPEILDAIRGSASLSAPGEAVYASETVEAVIADAREHAARGDHAGPGIVRDLLGIIDQMRAAPAPGEVVVRLTRKEAVRYHDYETGSEAAMHAKVGAALKGE